MYQFNIPTMQSGPESKDRQINSMIAQLTEQLQFYLNNMDEDNLNDNALIPAHNGGTGAKDQPGAFRNIVAAGGKLYGWLEFQNALGIYVDLSDGTACNLITRNVANNIWIGTEDAGSAQMQGNIYLATGSSGNVFISRNGARHKMLDYSFVFQQLFSGSFSSGSITVSGMSKYHIYLIYFDGDNTPLIALRRGNVVRGIGGFSSGSNNPWINTIGLSISGDELTYGNATQFYINSSTKAIGSITTGKVVAAIYGILGTEANV